MDLQLKEKSTWARFDTSNFPHVNVYMNPKIENSEEFQQFLDDWERLYSKNEKFVLYFDTTDVGMVSMKYAFKMRSFIRRLKEHQPRLLEKSYIKVKSRWVRFLLGIMFNLEKPVAPVYLYAGDISEGRFSVYNS
tara:strand:+ start:9871 stop:10275 length:405 start_codon:yes stop_codon:yes gene_type:complete